MTFFQAPYNFVPLSSFILQPDWAAQVSQDRPFSDGYGGELSLKLTACSPLCVGGRQTTADENTPRKVEFYRSPDGQLTIPGSSLKGMLRTVMEIATFGHFRQVQDQKFGFRDMKNQQYRETIIKQPVHAGWLNFEDGKWQLRPCRFVRAHQRTIHEYFGIPFDTWKRKNSAPDRYEALQGLQTVTFATRPPKFDKPVREKDIIDVAYDLGKGPYFGTVVVTGQPGTEKDENSNDINAYTGGISVKKYEFIFYDTHQRTITLKPEVVAEFRQIHEASNEWVYWKKQLGCLEWGIPVFYQTDQSGAPKSMGLSMMYRVVCNHSLHDAIGHTQPEHLEAGLDLASLTFGQTDRKDTRGYSDLRGRILPGPMKLNQSSSPRWCGPYVLQHPKPAFYPSYLNQSSVQERMFTLMDEDSRLAGWKRYPARQDEAIAVSPTSSSQTAVQTTLETVTSGACFSGKIRFHNLRAVELGALLWCIDFGQRSSLRHGLGMGKPFGLGQITLSISGAKIRANAPPLQQADDEILSRCRQAFVNYMNQQWQQATASDQAVWSDSEQVQALLHLADPATEKPYLGIPEGLEPFANAKKHQRALQHPLGGYEGLQPMPCATAQSQVLSAENMPKHP